MNPHTLIYMNPIFKNPGSTPVPPGTILRHNQPIRLLHRESSISYFDVMCLVWLQLRWRSSHYAVTHVRNKNSKIQVSPPNVVKVIFHALRICSKRKEFAPSGRKSFPLFWKGTPLKRITAWSSSLPLMCVFFQRSGVCHWYDLIVAMAQRFVDKTEEIA